MNDDWVEVVRPDGSREMVRAEETLNGMKQRIILILYDEIAGDGYGDKDSRLVAADRIVSEIIAPIYALTKPST